jgi:zinc/manganese transport system substrate-binding protein
MTGRSRTRLVVVLVVGLTALVHARAEAKVNVVATTEHEAVIARVVGGDRINVAYLAKGTQDPHAITPKPSFSVFLNRADLLIVNGQGLETAWLPTALAECTNWRIREGKPGYLDVSIGAALIPYAPGDLKAPPLIRGLIALESLAVSKPPDLTAGYNHHYWLDPANGDSMAKAILDKLVLLDSSNATVFKANYERFVVRLKEKLVEWDARMKPFEGMEIVSYHRGWIYLARRHGLKIVGYVEPSEPLLPSSTNLDNPPDRDEKAVLIARMAQSRVKLVVGEPYEDLGLLKEIAGAVGASVVILPSSVSRADGVDDYFVFFDRLYGWLTQALNAVRELP